MFIVIFRVFIPNIEIWYILICRLTCVDAVHVYNRYSQNYDSAHSYGRGGCGQLKCGPNFCCCIRRWYCQWNLLLFNLKI